LLRGGGRDGRHHRRRRGQRHHHTDHFYPGDTGIRVCTYPNGKVGKGMPYENVVSSGFEYPLVSGMLLDNNIEDAISICKMIRTRQSGVHRSPWNEPECGLYSARSMAGWNLFDQACGFTYDSTKASIGFHPTNTKFMMKMMMSQNQKQKQRCRNTNKENKEENSISSSSLSTFTFTCFCTFHCGFGEFQQIVTESYINNNNDDNDDSGFSAGTIQFTVLYGTTELKCIHLKTTAHVVEAVLLSNDGSPTPLQASIDPHGVITFGNKIALKTGSIIKLTLSSPCNSSSSSSSSEKLPKVSITTTITTNWMFSSSMMHNLLFYGGILTLLYILMNSYFTWARMTIYWLRKTLD